MKMEKMLNVKPAVTLGKQHKAVPIVQCKSKMTLLALSIGALVLGSATSQAATPSTQQQLDALQQQLEQQQSIMKEMQRQLDTQNTDEDQMLQEEKVIKQQTGTATSLSQQSDREVHAVAKAEGIDLSKVTDQFSKSSGHDFAVPQSNTVLTVSGFIRASAIYDTDQIASPTKFAARHIVVDGDPAGQPDSRTTFTVNASRFAIGSVTPTESSTVTTYMEWDFDGNTTTDSPDLRLRQAWGQMDNIILGGDLLIGQAWTTWDDITTLPETMDFEGPNASQQSRKPMIRWIRDFDDDLTLWLAFEQPDFNITDGSREGSMPDTIATLNWHGDWGHIKPAFVGRQIRAKDDINGAGKDTVFGWGTNVAGNINMPFLGEKDNFKFQVTYGAGIGSYNDDGGFDDALYNADGDLKTIDSFQAFGAIQHWWTTTLRSNVVYGWVNVDNRSAQPDDSLNETIYSAVNLVWSPMDKVTMGGEYLWGQRENKNNADASTSRIQFMTKFEF